MEYLAQQLINGLVLGAVYGLIALGYSMVYGVLRLINFAHGDVFMTSAFVSLIAILALQTAGVTSVALLLLLALLAAVAVAAAYGVAIERIAYRPLRKAPRLAPLISAIGVSIALQNAIQIAHGARVKPVAPLLSDTFVLYQGEGIGDFVLSISLVQILILATTAVLVAGFWFIVARTALGRSQRAVEQDATMAALLGINVNRTISTTFMLGAALAAVAGLMVTLYYGVIDFFMGFMAGIKAFTAAVVGGIGSLPGAIVGGLLIGLIEVLWSAYASVEYKDVAVFGVLILVLLIRPYGLFGRPDVTKV